MKKNYSIILSLLFLCLLYSCDNKQKQRIIGDYYRSRQRYPELRFNHEAMYQKVFSVYKDGTGYSHFTIKNRKSDNKGKFTWSVSPHSGMDMYRIIWENGEMSLASFIKGKQGKDIMVISVYNHDNKKDDLQYIGEKMILTELETDSIEYAELIRKKNISDLDEIKKNLSNELAELAQIIALQIEKREPLIINDFDGSTKSLSVDECMMLYYLLEEISMSSEKRNGIVYFNNIVNYFLSKHKNTSFDYE
jgi:hypothetical protein